MDKIFNKLFPPTCLNCNQIGECICDNCLYNCEILSAQFCVVCDKPSFNGFTHKSCFLQSKKQITQSISVFKYQNLVRDSIKTSKFGSKKFITLKKLAYESAYLLKEWGFVFKDFIIVPVPPTKSRYKLRGFNQAQIIAEIYSNKLNLNIENSIISRIKDTKHQYKLDKFERNKNIKNSFLVNKNINGLKILIIDDIITTASTLKEISNELYKNGVKEVRCLTLSKKFKEY